MFFLTYANMDNVASQVSGSSSVLAADWNTYVRDNFDDIKAGHVVLVTADRLALGVPATGTVVFDSTLGILMLFNGATWVVSPGSSLTSTQKIAIPTPATGSFIYDSTLGVFQFYNGSAWVNAQGSPPVLTTAQKTALGSVTTGTTVFDSTLASLQVYNGSAWVQRNLYLGNTTATRAIFTGSQTGNTDSSGVVSIATGLSSVDFFSITHGSQGTVGNLTIGRNQASSGGTIYVKCFIASTGAAYQNSTVTIDWMAVGTP